MKFVLPLDFVLCAAIFFSSCTFNYNEAPVTSSDFPEITMENIVYTRVRDGKIMARMQAESGERFEIKHIMNLKNYKFEQFDTNTEEPDAEGSGGNASVEINTNNVRMSQGVKIKVDTEDFEMETMRLEWDDKAHILRGGEDSPVQLRRGDGSEINGDSFHADIRSRSWVFGSNVRGVYFSEEETETGKESAASQGAKPAEGINAEAKPAQDANQKPAQETNTTPAHEINQTPAQEASAAPAQETNAKPAQEINTEAKPAQEAGQSPAP